MRYCGREFSAEEIAVIHQLIAENPKAHRCFLSKAVCEAFGWRKPDGHLKEMSCRVAMIRMHNDGIIRLPPPMRKHYNGRKYSKISTRSDDPGHLFTDSAGMIQDLRIELVSTPVESHLWNEYIHRYHYLGYKPLPGAQLRYIVRSNDQVLALLGFGAAAWKTAPRDQFIGWTPEKREQRLHLVVNNARFLILPWVKSLHLASKVLALTSKRLPQDWQSRYNYRPVLLETFVEIQKFVGTSYKAANWICLGNTQGRGKLDIQHLNAQTVKSIWAYPLARNFRQILCS